MGNYKFLALVSPPSKNNFEMLSRAMQPHTRLLSEPQQDAPAPTAVNRSGVAGGVLGAGIGAILGLPSHMATPHR